MDVPVLLICYNRPDYVSQMIDAFRECQVSDLFVFKDGPRPDNADDEQASRLIEKLIEQIDWDCKVVTNYMHNNLGCGYGPFSAISWAFQYTEELIILEDDCVPTKSFFEFCENMLERYRNDVSVSLISGFSRLQESSLFKGYDYIFSQYGPTLGWATWKRTWSGFDMQLRNLQDFFEHGGFNKQFSTYTEARLFNKRYQDFLHDPNLYKHSWDIQFGLYSRINGALRVIPSKSLIKYIGYDGTHYSQKNSESDIFTIQPVADFSFKNFPAVVESIRDYDQIYFEKYVYTETRLIYKVINKIKHIFTNKRQKI